MCEFLDKMWIFAPVCKSFYFFTVLFGNVSISFGIPKNISYILGFMLNWCTKQDLKFAVQKGFASKLGMSKSIGFQGWASLVRKSFLRMITFMLVSFSQIISNIVVLNVDVFATDWECRSRDVYCIAGDAAGNQCYHWHTNLKFMQGQHQAAT